MATRADSRVTQLRIAATPSPWVLDDSTGTIQPIARIFDCWLRVGVRRCFRTASDERPRPPRIVGGCLPSCAVPRAQYGAVETEDVGSASLPHRIGRIPGHPAPG